MDDKSEKFEPTPRRKTFTYIDPRKPKEHVPDGQAIEFAKLAHDLTETPKKIMEMAQSLAYDFPPLGGEEEGVTDDRRKGEERRGVELKEAILEAAKYIPVVASHCASVMSCAELQGANTREWINEVLQGTAHEIQKTAGNGDVLSCVNLLRFLVETCNVNILHPTELIVLWLELLSQKSNNAETAVYMVISSLIFLSQDVCSEFLTDIKDVIDGCEKALSERKLEWIAYCAPVRDGQLRDRLAEGVDAVKQLLDGYEVKSIIRPFQRPKMRDDVLLPSSSRRPIPNKTEDADAAPKYDFSNLPSSMVYRHVTRVWNMSHMLDADDETHKHGLCDLWALEDILMVTIDAFHDKVALCAQRLNDMPSAWHMYQTILVQTLLSEMLTIVPRSKYPPLFYYRLLQILQQSTGQFSALLNFAIGYYLNNVAYWDSETLDTLTDFVGFWFSLGDNIKNILQWVPKEEFHDEKKILRSAQVFVKMVLDHLSRRVWRDKINESLPVSLLPFLPPATLPSCILADPDTPKPLAFKLLSHVVQYRKAETNAEPLVTFANRMVNLSAEDTVKELLQLKEEEEFIKTKAEDEPIKKEEPVDDIKDTGADDWIGSPPIPPKMETADVEAQEVQDVQVTGEERVLEDDSEDVPMDPNAIIVLIIQVFLVKGTKTLTHLDRLLENYCGQLSKIKRDYAEKLYMKECDFDETVISTIVSFWKDLGLRISMCVGAFTRWGVVLPESVATYFVSTDSDIDAIYNTSAVHAATRTLINEGKRDAFEGCVSEATQRLTSMLGDVLLRYTVRASSCTDEQEARGIYLRMLAYGRAYIEHFDPNKLQFAAVKTEDETPLFDVVSALKSIKNQFG